MSSGLQQARDSIGTNPNIIPIPFISSESVIAYEEPLFIKDRFISNSWIAGSSTNGIVGTWTGTAGGGQLVVGDTTNTEVLLRVVPVNQVYCNFLRDTPANQSAYGLDSANTTATIDTTLNKITWGINQWVYWRVAYNDLTVNYATLIVNLDASRTSLLSDDVTGGTCVIQVSADGKSTWTSITNWNTETRIGTPGTDVYLRWQCRGARYWLCANTAGYEVPIILKLRS